MILSLRRSRQFMVAIPAIVALFILMLLQDEKTILIMGIPRMAWRVAFVALAAGLIGFTLWNYRCPACDRFLSRRFLRSGCDLCRGYP